MGELGCGIQLASRMEPEPRQRTAVHELRKWKILEELPELFLFQVQYAIVARRDDGHGHDYHYAILVSRDDEVYVLGDNRAGQLGVDRTDSTNVLGLTLVKELSGLEIIGFSAGWTHVAAWTKSGKLLLMGRNGTGTLGHGHTFRTIETQQVILQGFNTEKVIKAACGLLHTVCLTEAGNIYAWGDNVRRQCSSKSEPHITSPMRVEFHRVGAASFVDVASSHNTCFALADDGNVYAWGDNQFGQLGSKSLRRDTTSPIKVVLPGGVVVTQIACGEEHCLALTTEGEVYAWGKNEYCQLGEELTKGGSPVKVPVPEVVSVAASNSLSTSICLTSQSQVYAWGRFTEPSTPKLVKFETINDFLAHENLGMYETWASLHILPEREPNLQKYLWNAVGERTVVFDVQGQQVVASKFCLKRCATLRDKMRNEWKKLLETSEPIKIDDVHYRGFEAFINFLHTDELVVEEEHIPGLLLVYREYKFEIFRSEVLNMIRSKIKCENALNYYIDAVYNNDLALGLIALNSIASKAADILDQADLEQIEPKTVLQLMKDLKGMGAFKCNNNST